MRTWIFGIFAFSLVAIGCGDATKSGAAADGESCGVLVAPFDSNRSCVDTPIKAAGLCSKTGKGLGIYVLCAISPDGTFYLVDASSDEQFTGEGWTFGPQGTAKSIFHIPAVSDEYEAACEKAAMNPTTNGIPKCATADAGGDAAGSSDAAGE